MNRNSVPAGSRESTIRELDERLAAALDLSDTVDEFLVSAQIALALDTLRGATSGLSGGITSAQEVGVSAG